MTVSNLEREALRRARRYVADRAAYRRPVGETDLDGAIPFAANGDAPGAATAQSLRNLAKRIPMPGMTGAQ